MPRRKQRTLLFEIPGGFTQGQEVWSLASNAHDTKPLRYGDRGFVQGPAESDPEKVTVRFDPPAELWDVEPSALSTTKPSMEVCLCAHTE